MGCSAFSLSLATITSVAGLALIVIAFSTDNWTEVRVERRVILQKLGNSLNNSDRTVTPQRVENDRLFFSRNIGLFRECFPGEKERDRPRNLTFYISPTGTYCINVDYHIPDDDQVKKFSDDNMSRLHMARSCVALFIVGFFWIAVAFFVGLTACWMRSPSRTVATGILMLLAGLFCAGAMGLWHGKEYYERFKLREDNYFNSWPKLLKDNVDFYYGWSYIIAWIGIGWCLLASIIFLCAAKCLQDEKHPQESKSMQYLMPVYPSKQQPYGYGYVYPGPYYNQAQYGPYNY